MQRFSLVSNGVDNHHDFEIKLDILFENEDFLVINKPAGLVVHPVKSLEEKTLVTLLLKHYPDIKNVGDSNKTGNPPTDGLRPGIVHRLDKDVSGLLIIPKTQSAFNYFKNEFSSSTKSYGGSSEVRQLANEGGQNHQILKEYFALVHGHPHKEKDIISLALARDAHGKTTLAKSANLENIKESWTEYEVIRHFMPSRIDAERTQTDADGQRKSVRQLADPRKSANGFTLLKVKIKTGRTHQIRIHLKSIGHPIVGDQLHKIKRQKKVELGRVFLHAFHLAFKDPNGQQRDFKIDLPIELKTFLQNLN